MIASHESHGKYANTIDRPRNELPPAEPMTPRSEGKLYRDPKKPMKRMFLAIGWILNMFLGPFFVGCVERDQTATPANAQELLTLLQSVAPWRDANAYPTAEVRQLLHVAKVFQSSDPTNVETALTLFATRSRSNRREYDESKPFLMLRVVFELPDSAPASLRFVSGWEGKDGDVNRDGTVNLGWPLRWHWNHPRVTDSYMGFHGFVYDPAAEYKFLLKNFRPRKLK